MQILGLDFCRGTERFTCQLCEDSWGRPNARTTIQPRKCYEATHLGQRFVPVSVHLLVCLSEDAPVRIVNSSLVQLPPTEDATVVAAEVRQRPTLPKCK